MISSLRTAFNAGFSEERHQKLLAGLDALCGAHVEFRVSETPVFIPRRLMREMEDAGREMILRLVGDGEYLRRADEVIPPGFRVPGTSEHPLFVAVDFGITRDANGRLVPRLIEMQGFPTLFAYQPLLSRMYREVYNLLGELTSFCGGLGEEGYTGLVRKAILGGHDPEHVVLLEIDPLRQKTLPDFTATERLCGIATLNIRDVTREGKRLFYERNGRRIPIRRIYNRVIVDELVRLGVPLPFRFTDELEVEWAGHPNWFFRLSKFSLPFLEHPTVPRTRFLADLGELPDDPGKFVLKPLFSFAGHGVIIGPTRKDVEAIPAAARWEYVLQEKVDYVGVVDTPYGPTKAEVRVIYFWLDHLTAVNTIVRMGRGGQMGVDFNKGLRWVGGSAGFISDREE